MALRKYKPTSPGRRFATVSTYEEITKSTPEKALSKGKKRCSGRNHSGRITVRHRGGGAKRRFREIDFRREKLGIPARVAAIA